MSYGTKTPSRAIAPSTMAAKGNSLEAIGELVGRLKFGSVQITIRDERIVQIETIVKRKLDK